MLLIFLLSLLSFVKGLSTTKEEDKISKLPSYNGGTIGFEMYSGYLTALTGELFYFLTKSSSKNASTDPLVLWLNGGPGCSSLLGAFIELGPFHPYDNGTSLEYNAYSWNNFAHMLFLESPPCVGFSYPFSGNCDNYTTGDNKTATDNYYALQSFLTKFPEYVNRSFHISGESYAGHYIPELTQLIIQENELISQGQSNNIFIHLEAIAIGNPYTQRDSNWFEGWLPTMAAFGIISEEQYSYLLSGDCANQSYTTACANQSNIYLNSSISDINVYDVNANYPCSKYTRQQNTLLRYIFNSNDYQSNLEEANIWAYPYAACDEQDLQIYLNRKDVQEALHVNRSRINFNNGFWLPCSNWDGYDNADDTRDMATYYPYILRNNVRVLIYSGNDDLVCAYLGTRYWVYHNLSETDKGDRLTNWTTWTVNDEAGGWYQEWSKFTFLVVRDAGHEVPEYQPSRAYTMFQRFLRNDYSDYFLTIDDHGYESYGSSSSDTDKSKYIWTGVAIGAISILCLGGIIWLIIYYRNKQNVKEYSPMK